MEVALGGGVGGGGCGEKEGIQEGIHLYCTFIHAIRSCDRELHGPGCFLEWARDA